MTKERPIIFSGPMVRAIIEGRKTQTRRVVKNQGSLDFLGGSGDDRNDPSMWGWRVDGNGRDEFVPLAKSEWYDSCARCPHGVPGDVLWVREKFYLDDVEWCDGGPLPKVRPPSADEYLYYRADGECCDLIPECSCAEVGKPRWRSSIHMPRWACRLTLAVKAVRVERLQDISEADAIAEGIERHDDHPTSITWRDYSDEPPEPVDLWEGWLSASNSFRSLWDSINGKRHPWAGNPWVWVVEFEKEAASA